MSHLEKVPVSKMKFERATILQGANARKQAKEATAF